MPTVRELAPGEDALALPALRELRPHLGVDEEALAAVARLREEQGYRLLGSFPAGDPAEDGRPAAAVAGFRLVELLAWGRALYVDDLSTRAAARRRGHASALLDALARLARDTGCAQLHLDSGVGPHRADAHALYHRAGLRIASFHFSRRLDSS